MDQESTPALKRVSLGLGFVFAGIASAIFVFTAGVILQTMSEYEMPTVSLLLNALALLALLIHLAGQILCLWVPPEAGARSWLVVAIALNLGAQVLALLPLPGIDTLWRPEEEASLL